MSANENASEREELLELLGFRILEGAILNLNSHNNRFESKACTWLK